MATYYVDGAVGNDANAGTSEGAGNAWATIQKAMDTVAADDTVYVKASATYSEDVTIETNGGIFTPIHFIGYTTSTSDNGKVTISGTTNCLKNGAADGDFYMFWNFIFSGASSTGVLLNLGDDTLWYNCEFNNNGGAGLQLNDEALIVNCVAHGNTTFGFDLDSSPNVVGCKVYANGGVQIFCLGNGELFYKNVVYGATGSSKLCELNTTELFVANTLDGENVALQGVELIQGSACICIDNIIYDCTTGVQMNAGPVPSAYFLGHNLMNSNTTDYSTATPATVGLNDVTSAPAFTDEANDDYRPSRSSPAVDAQLKPGGIT
jgi:hypothetical protein